MIHNSRGEFFACIGCARVIQKNGHRSSLISREIRFAMAERIFRILAARSKEIMQIRQATQLDSSRRGRFVFSIGRLAAAARRFDSSIF